jgi:hypothetical protein
MELEASFVPHSLRRHRSSAHFKKANLGASSCLKSPAFFYEIFLFFQLIIKTIKGFLLSFLPYKVLQRQVLKTGIRKNVVRKITNY